MVFGAFQRERNYRAVQHRYRRLAAVADAAVVFADFAGAARSSTGEPAEVPIDAEDAVGNEWAVVIDAPGYAACLLAWERPRSAREEAETADRDRRFETLWTMDPRVVRQAALVGCSLARASAPDLAGRIERTLADRPLAVESPAPALTALTNRLVAYLEAAELRAWARARARCLTSWPPIVRPSWATSPAALTAVVTSSVPPAGRRALADCSR